VKVDIDELWESIWSDDGGGITYWCDAIRKTDGSGIDLWKVDEDYAPNPSAFKLLSDGKWHKVTLEQLADAYIKVKQLGLMHCGNYPIDIEDPDACFGDTVLQYAVFGEMVYG
jgi:hypothetical protein